MPAFLKAACAAALGLSSAVAAEINYDESKVRDYRLEDPLAFADGSRVSGARDWERRRREIVGIFEREMYGRIPPAPETLVTDMTDDGFELADLAIRRQYRMWFRADRSGPHVDWLVLLPNRPKDWRGRRAGGHTAREGDTKAPVVLFLNYGGNHEFLTSTAVAVPDSCWLRNEAARGIVAHRPEEASRGFARRTDHASPFPVETILARGYAVMTACYGQVSPDVEVRKGDSESLAYTGVFELWNVDRTAPDATGALGAWAWALSRGLDLAERIREIDAKRNVVTGCSRLGKTALLAASRDARFAVCAPVQTGAGGVPLAKRNFGEDVATLVRFFPHWFCPAYRKYANNELAQPFDQHLLIASIAPRWILVLGYTLPWYDPKGELLACRAASPAWTLNGCKGLPETGSPKLYGTSAIGPSLGYYVRGGQHGISGYDWVQILNFADMAW